MDRVGLNSVFGWLQGADYDSPLIEWEFGFR
jgi:hypothetical protein